MLKNLMIIKIIILLLLIFLQFIPDQDSTKQNALIIKIFLEIILMGLIVELRIIQDRDIWISVKIQVQQLEIRFQYIKRVIIYLNLDIQRRQVI